MHRYFVLLTLILFFSCKAQAQEPSLYNNYLCNNFYNINPAAAGYDGAFISQFTATKKWIGMSGSPMNQVLSNSLRLGEEEFYDPTMFINKPFINYAPRVGIGLTFFNESNGPLQHTGAMLAYAYHLSIHDNRISFGLSGLVTQYHLNTREFKPVNPIDASLYTNTSAFIPDINFGAFFYNRKLFAGLSVISLVNFNKIPGYIETFPSILLCAGNKFIVNDRIKFEPSVFIWKFGKGSLLTDINGKLYFRDKNWIMLSYQGIGGVLTGFGLNLKPGLQIYYTYTTNTTGLSTINAGSHSISLRVNIFAFMRKHN